MADQYDDGRYDGGHRYAETSIGYLPITAVRGGIKYPASAEAQRRIARENSLKGTPVAKNTEALQRQLDELTRSHEATGRNIERMKKELAKSKRPAPPAIQNMWKIDVKFSTHGTVYQYLILRHGTRFYTTGTNAQDSSFSSWGAVLDWLDGVSAHGPLVPLTVDVRLPNPLDGRVC